MDVDPRPSPLALAVLGLLAGGPLHPYRMQRLIKEWGKDQVINVGQRANLYKAIKRLQEAGLIAVRNTERDQQYPERTVYELTEQGRHAVLQWLTEMVAAPHNEFPRFPAALSFVMLLGPGAAQAALEERAETLRGQLKALDADIDRYPESLPRVAILETEYQRAMVAAELDWVNNVIDELRTGGLDWTEEDFASAATAYLLD